MRHNKVAFGTPEAKAWFLSKLRPANTPTSADDSLTLRMIFNDFYTSIAQYRNETTNAAASEALTIVEIRDSQLRTRDSARIALVDELRRIMSSLHLI
jgi:hypothetical protein